jgi:hypothetical protein
MKKYLLLMSIVLVAVGGVAQTEVPEPPVPTSTETAASSAPRYEDNVRPLSGVQNFDLGNRADRMNVLTPSFTLSESYGTNPGLTFGADDPTVWGSTTNIGGSLRLARGDTRKLLSLSYGGSAQISGYNSDLNTQIHSLEFTQTVTAGRWTYLVGDTFTYQPNAFAANGAFLYPGSDAGTGSTIQPGIAPDTSILSQQNPQLNNTAIGQVTYGLSRASTVTGSFSYGILHYLEGDFLDTRQLNATGGYDHRFGRNTVGVEYTYSKFMYENLVQNFDTNTVQMTYGRRLLGRFSIALGAGPTFRSANFGGISTHDVDVSGRASLRYAGNRTGLSLSYDRGVTGGSGVTAGAITDSLSASADRNLTPTLSGNFSIGFSKNKSDSVGAEFNNVTVGTGVSRSIGRYMSLSLGYRGQRQTGNNASSNLSTHSVVASFMWHFRPVRLQ